MKLFWMIDEMMMKSSFLVQTCTCHSCQSSCYAVADMPLSMFRHECSALGSCIHACTNHCVLYCCASHGEFKASVTRARPRLQMQIAFELYSHNYTLLSKALFEPPESRCVFIVQFLSASFTHSIVQS